MSKRETEASITYTDEPSAVSIRITGAAFDNLKAIAEVLNRWDDNDLTPADIVSRFMACSDEWITLDKRSQKYPITTLAGSICSAYSGEPDMPELEAAFNAAGFSTTR